jgi:hypothetical protein
VIQQVRPLLSATGGSHSAFSSRDITRVKVTKPVSAADMGRLEHACAPALATHEMDLEIDLRG